MSRPLYEPEVISDKLETAPDTQEALTAIANAHGQDVEQWHFILDCEGDLVAIVPAEKAEGLKKVLNASEEPFKDLPGAGESAPTKQTIDTTIKVNIYHVLEDKVAEGLRYGYQRAHKHTPTPTKEDTLDELHRAVMNSICEILEFP